MIKAPFTDEQIKNLMEYQRGEGGWAASPMHPFTCINHGRSDHILHPDYLVATHDGWVCPACDYTQDWAHSFMAEKRVYNPLTARYFGILGKGKGYGEGKKET